MCSSKSPLCAEEEGSGDMRIEPWPASYDYRPRFPEIGEVMLFECGAVYAASEAEGHAVISNESLPGELLGEGGPDYVTIRIFEMLAECNAYLEALLA